MSEPAPDKLADDHDDLDWSIERDGRMKDYATTADPATEPWDA